MQIRIMRDDMSTTPQRRHASGSCWFYLKWPNLTSGELLDPDNDNRSFFIS